MKNALIILAMMMIPFTSSAQRNKKVNEKSDFCIGLHGNVTDYFTSDGIKGAKVSLKESNKDVFSAFTLRKGFYAFELDSGKVYTVEFSKEDMVTKTVIINTKNCFCSDTMFYDMELQMTMFKESPGFDFSLFKIPIAMSMYDPSVRNMTWFSNDYTNRIRPILDKTMSAYVKSVNGYFLRKGEVPTIPSIEDLLEPNSGDIAVVDIKNGVKEVVVDIVESSLADTISKIGYNDNDSIFEVETATGLFFTVQVGVYSRSRDLKRVYNINNLNSELLPDGKIRYTSGRFISIETSEAYRKVVYGLGVKDAFITAYYKGKRVTIKKANDLIDQYGFEILLK